MTKIAIIGAAGTLGAACANTIAMNDGVEELCLIDVNETILDNHMMDLENAFPNKNIYRGTYEEMVNSSIVIITAGVPNRSEETSRDVYLKDNIHIIEQIGRNIAKYVPDATVITASNPVDLLNYYLYKRFNFAREQLIGYSLNDSYRFEWAIRKTLGINQKSKLKSPVIGEHGDTQVLVFSQVEKDNEKLIVTPEQKQQIQEEINTWFVRFNRLNVPRTTGWTTGIGVSRLVHALLNKELSYLIGSVILSGEYNSTDVSIGVPVAINHEGVQKIVEWELVKEEEVAFQQSVLKIKQMIAENSTIFSEKLTN